MKTSYLIERTVILHRSPGDIELSVRHHLEIISLVNNFLEVYRNTAALNIWMCI